MLREGERLRLSQFEHRPGRYSPILVVFRLLAIRKLAKSLMSTRSLSAGQITCKRGTPPLGMHGP